MTAHRRILKKAKLAYLLVGSRPHKYRRGRSQILYIGTTKKGADRIATSVAYRAEDVLKLHGFRWMDVYVASCSAVPGFQSWRFVERALLAGFLLRYSDLPFCNRQGRKLRWDEKFEKRIHLKTINKILRKFGN